MKPQRFSDADQPAGAHARQAPDVRINENKMDCALCPEELARTAYFAYVNEGCPEGRHVQHWLDAEAGLIKARNLTRTHASHNRT